jgi:hypothetical protein
MTLDMAIVSAPSLGMMRFAGGSATVRRLAPHGTALSWRVFLETIRQPDVFDVGRFRYR